MWLICTPALMKSWHLLTSYNPCLRSLSKVRILVHTSSKVKKAIDPSGDFSPPYDMLPGPTITLHGPLFGLELKASLHYFSEKTAIFCCLPKPLRPAALAVFDPCTTIQKMPIIPPLPNVGHFN